MAATSIRWLTLLTSLLLGGCVGIPKGVEPVVDFQLERYLGTWYEIARLDHPFERGLERVTATYNPRQEGGIRVVNRGYHPASGTWREATGKAFLVASEDVGRLKVSFFGPFYGGYNIIALDHADYNWAMVCGPSRDYLWILARQPTLAKPIYAGLLDQANELGFATENLIRVRHADRE